jgi:hypothetical protein
MEETKRLVEPLIDKLGLKRYTPRTPTQPRSGTAG